MRVQTLLEARWIFAMLVVLLLASFLFSAWLALVFLVLILYMYMEPAE